MIKKLLYLLIFIFLTLLNISFSFAASMCNVSYHEQGGGCYERMVCREVDTASCSTSSGTTTHDLPACAYSCSVCGVVDYCSPSSLCNLFTSSVGGCNNTPLYCSTSPVYTKVSSFLGLIENASRWIYFSTIGKDNNTYKCVISYTRPSGSTVILIAGTALSSHNPVGSPSCLNDTEYNALINTNCDLSAGWAINSGYVTNYRDGTAVTQNPDDAEGPIVPTGSTSESPTGQPITSSTGFDGNKDGFDDVTGQPLPFTPSSGSGSGDSDGDGTDEVEIKDPDPDEIPAVPSAPDADTSIESPEKTDLVGLFDIFATSPFVSLFSGQHVLLSGMVCSLSAEIYGKTIIFDFCDSRIANILDWLGVFLVGYAALVGLISIFN